MIKCNKIVCSLESLDILKEIIKFDVIILEEIETVANQFDSCTMKSLSVKNFELLCKYINHADKVFVADAFVMNRTLDFINHFDGDKALLINDTNICNYKAIEVHEDLILDVLFKSLKSGENNYCCFGSERKMRKFIKIIEDKNILKKEETLYYSSSSDDIKNSHTFKNVNTE